MGKQISKNIPRILTLFVVAILISSLGVASRSDWNSDDSQSDNPHDDSQSYTSSQDSKPPVSVSMDSDGLGSLEGGDWMGFLKDFHPENMTQENKTSDRDKNGDRDNGCKGPGCGGPGYGGYGGYGGAIVPMPMYGSPMYGSEPPMFGGEPSTTAVPSEPNVCKSKVSSAKCHKDKCALSKHKHKHKHKHHSKKHKAEKHC